MTFRSDIRIEWNLNPRLITVEEPSVIVTIQDLYDTLRVHEERPSSGLPYPAIVRAGGKEVIGANFVGVTLTLINAQLSFEQRIVAAVVSNATSADALGKTLVDTTATFVTDGIKRGDTVWNTTDLSFATVITVVDENTLVHRQLDGGSDNQWEIGDSYRVYKTVLCEVVGGNLVAVAEDEVTPIEEFVPTAFTSAEVEKSTSPTIAAANISADLWGADPDSNNDPNTMGRIIRGPRR